MTRRPAPASVVVRKVAYDEFPVVRDLFQDLHAYNASLDPRFSLSDHWEAQLLATFTDTQDHHAHLWLLAECEGRPAGLLWGKEVRDSAIFRHRSWIELVAIYVVPDFHGNGVAEGLVDGLAAWAREKGQDAIQAFVTASNVRALRFYEKQGFRVSQKIVRRLLDA